MYPVLTKMVNHRVKRISLQECNGIDRVFHSN